MILFALLAGFCATSSQRYQGSACNYNTRLVQHTPAVLGSILTLDSRKIIGVQPNVNGTGVVQEYDSVSGLLISQKSLAQLDINWANYSSYKLSPKGEVLLLWCGRTLLVHLKGDLRSYLISPTPIDTWAVWSPDEKSVATSNGTTVTIWSSSGNSLAHVNVSGMSSMCWSPGEFLVVVTGSGISMATSAVAWYYANGTQFSSITLTAGSYYEIDCNSLSTVAIGLTLVDISGHVTSRDEGEEDPTWDLRHNRVLGCAFNGACTLYDRGLGALLELPETSGDEVLGFTDDNRLITTDPQGTYWWDVETLQLSRLDFLPTPNLLAVGVGWIDQDTVLFWENNDDTLFKRYNVRTRQYVTSSYPIGDRWCLMYGELYNLFSANGMIAVYGNGSELRRWYGGGDTLGCGNNYVWMTKGKSLSVWNKAGGLIQQISLELDESIHYVALHNISRFTVVTVGLGVHVWNSVANKLELLQESTGLLDVVAQWSPDGTWLLVLLQYSFTLPLNVLRIYQNHRQLILQREGYDSTFYDHFMGQIWSTDSNWALLSSPPILISTKLNTAISSGLSDAFQLFWNPETKEILTITLVNGATLRMWKHPTPALLALVANNQVGLISPSSISLIGVGFISSSVQTMIHWVDSSTGAPQCMFPNATVADAFTLSLGNFTLPDPAMYTVHIRYPTTHPTSPWLNSEFQFATICGGATKPTWNKTGGVTTCACPYSDDGGTIFPVGNQPGDLICTCPRDYYMVPRAQELKCERCPEHGRCDGSPSVLSEAGYWPTSENPYYFLPCAVGACYKDNQCSPCHEGPVCGLCKAGCGQYGFGRCHDCNAFGVDILLFIVGLFSWIVFCTVQSLFALGWRNNVSRGNNSAQLIATILSTIQVNVLLLSVDVKVESLFSKILGFSEEAAQGGGIQSSVISCLLLNSGWSLSHVHMAKQVVLLLMPCIGWIVLVGFRAWLRWRNISTSIDIVKVPTVVLWSSLQSASTTSLFQTLSCTDVNSQGFRSRLKHDISVLCYGHAYWTWIGVVTIPAVIITIIFIPLTISWLLRYRPSASESGHLRFLVKGYRFDWWYLVTFYRKVLLCVVVTFTKNPFHVAMTLFISATVHILIWPSTSFLVNVSEAISLMASTFVFGVAGAVGLMNADQIGTIELLSVGIFSYCVQIGLLVYDRWQEHDSKDKDDEVTKNGVVLEPMEQESSYSSHVYTRLHD